MKLRCKFQKTDYLRFIGHLDVMRTAQKILRRAGFDVLYSEGFSPHPKLSFATPLGLGAESTGEYFDVEFGTCPPKAELLARFNAATVPALTVLDACILPDDAKNAMSLLAAADYEVEITDETRTGNAEAFFNGLLEFTAQPEILVTKETKKNRVETDLKKQIRKIRTEDGKLFLQVDTGSVSNLKPELVLSTFAESEGIPFVPTDFRIKRTELYGEEAGVLKTLLSYGNSDF